jgi:hypothetical protein
MDYHRMRQRTIDATVSRSSTRLVRTPSYSVVVGTGHRWWSQSPMRLPGNPPCHLEITIDFLGFPRLQVEILPKPVWPLVIVSRERRDLWRTRKVFGLRKREDRLNPHQRSDSISQPGSEFLAVRCFCVKTEWRIQTSISYCSNSRCGKWICDRNMPELSQAQLLLSAPKSLQLTAAALALASFCCCNFRNSRQRIYWSGS